MKRQILSAMLILAVAGGALLVAGCETEAQNKALLGTAIGAGAGQLIGGNTQATLIGAGVGGGAGYMIGNEQDKSRQRQENAQLRADMNTETIWITNSNGSQVPVRLVKDGPAYIGPRGERYPSRPTEEQLKTVYGF